MARSNMILVHKPSFDIRAVGSKLTQGSGPAAPEVTLGRETYVEIALGTVENGKACTVIRLPSVSQAVAEACVRKFFGYFLIRVCLRSDATIAKVAESGRVLDQGAREEYWNEAVEDEYNLIITKLNMCCDLLYGVDKEVLLRGTSAGGQVITGWRPQPPVTLKENWRPLLLDFLRRSRPALVPQDSGAQYPQQSSAASPAFKQTASQAGHPQKAMTAEQLVRHGPTPGSLLYALEPILETDLWRIVEFRSSERRRYHALAYWGVSLVSSTWLHYIIEKSMYAASLDKDTAKPLSTNTWLLRLVKMGFVSIPDINPQRTDNVPSDPDLAHPRNLKNKLLPGRPWEGSKSVRIGDMAQPAVLVPPSPPFTPPSPPSHPFPPHSATESIFAQKLLLDSIWQPGSRKEESQQPLKPDIYIKNRSQQTQYEHNSVAQNVDARSQASQQAAAAASALVQLRQTDDRDPVAATTPEPGETGAIEADIQLLSVREICRCKPPPGVSKWDWLEDHLAGRAHNG